jgi:hypothetical protein
LMMIYQTARGHILSHRREIVKFLTWRIMGISRVWCVVCRFHIQNFKLGMCKSQIFKNESRKKFVMSHFPEPCFLHKNAWCTKPKLSNSERYTPLSELIRIAMYDTATQNYCSIRNLEHFSYLQNRDNLVCMYIIKNGAYILFKYTTECIWLSYAES